MATPDAGNGSRFVFVLGTGRCGSTLVEEVLCRHPSVGFVSNLEDRFNLPLTAGRWNGSLYRRLPAAVTQKSRVRYAPSEAYRVLLREVSPVLASPMRDLVAADVTPWLEARFRRFFIERASVQHTQTFLHKFTGWPRAGFIRGVFPSGRFIHVVRDGRAVANSWLQMPWWLGFEGPDHWQWGPLPDDLAAEWDESGRSFVVLAGLLWKMLIDAFDNARKAIPATDWLEIRYEDVAANPRTAFATMLEFCGLPWDAEFERGFERHTFTASRSDAFRRDLAPDDVDRLSQILATELAARRYS
ncbi:MAG: sulfotransferase [Candidatus Dormiibacterota bacterium]